MHVQSFIVFLAAMLLSPTVVKAQVATVVLPGFGAEIASISIAGVGSDGQTTLIVSPATPTNSGDPLAVAGTATVVVSPSKDKSKGFSDEDTFHLGDGTNVDNKCSFEDAQASCTAILAKASMTTTVTFATSIPSSAVKLTQDRVSPKSSAADHFQTMVARAVALAGVVVGILL